VIVDLFEGGWLELGAGLPHARVIVARHPAPPADKKVRVGKRIGEWIYELFITTLDANGFLVEDVLDLYHGRGAFEVVLADEDVEEDPDRWCSYTYAVWPGTLANCLSMGVEPAAHTGKDDARR